MISEKIKFTANGNVLAGNLFVSNKESDKPGLLFLHGGGSGSKERFTELQSFLAKKGYVSLAFDFPGVGESKGDFEKGTLSQRIKDAQVAYYELKKLTPSIVIVGSSMGGHVAARLIEIVDARALILLYSAAYAAEAENMLLNENFTNVLRQPNSWINSPAFKAIEEFDSKVLIVYGELEIVIPKEVQDRYKKALGNKGRFVVIPNGTHGLFSPQTPIQKEAMEKTFEEIAVFLNTL